MRDLRKWICTGVAILGFTICLVAVCRFIAASASDQSGNLFTGLIVMAIAGACWPKADKQSQDQKT